MTDQIRHGVSFGPITRGSAFAEIDVLGGWISQVVVLFILDAAALAVLLLVSAKEVNRT